MTISVIKAKATLDVDYCVSDQLFADIGSSRDFFAVDDLFSIFAIARSWALKTELAIVKLENKTTKTKDEVEQLNKMKQILCLLNDRFVLNFSAQLQEHHRDVISKVRTWAFSHGRFVKELLLVQEYFALCRDIEINAFRCDELHAYKKHVDASLEDLKQKLQG